MDRIAMQDRRENVGNRLTEPDFVIRIMNGGKNMSALGGILNPEEVTDLVAYLQASSDPQLVSDFI